MTRNRTIARVTSAGVLACGLAIYAAQAGILPGVTRDAGRAPAQDPDVASAHAAGFGLVPIPRPYRPAAAGSARAGATTTGYVPDGFVKLQAHFLPPRSGFSALPAIRSDLPATPGAVPNTVAPRPAAFSPAARPATPGPRPVDGPRGHSRFGLPCGLEVSAEAGPAAMIALDITAPCHPDAEGVIEHAGITVTIRTDAVGLATIDLPALDSPAIVAVRLADGTEESVMLPVPDLSGYERFAVSWSGDLGIELHAREDGASWQSGGHVRPDAPREPAADGAGGFLTMLGDRDVIQPRLAQVYTAPLRLADGVALSIDAPVTAENCARPASARILRSVAGRVDASPMGFTYPGCEATGDTLVLQNLAQDLRLAAN